MDDLKTGHFLSNTHNWIVYRGGPVLVKLSTLTRSVDDISLVLFYSHTI